MSEKINGPKEHVIDGVKYREVARKAEVGEKVVLVDAGHSNGRYKNGDILVVKDAKRWGDNSGITPKEFNFGIFHEEYRVLEPVAEAPADPLYTCDNCEKVLGDTACSNFGGGTYCSTKCAEAPAEPAASSPDLLDLVSRLIAKVARLEDELDTVRKNVQTFAEHTESNAGDIRMLDERTQVLNAIQAFYTEGER